ncbi:hypothetical protein FB107DRAFT_203406 [Schizophyllum commune]
MSQSYALPFPSPPLAPGGPQIADTRVPIGESHRSRPRGVFLKHSKNAEVSLRLDAQEEGTSLPVYGRGADIEGAVLVQRTDGVRSVEVKIEGKLRLKEMGEGGTNSVRLCSESALLWIRNPRRHDCPPILPFRFQLPLNHEAEDKTYPLPPTHTVKLSGLPGFYASIEYTIIATIQRPPSGPNLPLVKSSFLGITPGTITLPTAFLYQPRTRPPDPLPRPLSLSRHGFRSAPEWICHDASIQPQAGSGANSIAVRLYLPTARVFALTQRIPFHLSFHSTSHTLALFLPIGPTAHFLGGKRPTRLQLLRQSAVNVRNATSLGTKTDMWRVDRIGEASFRHTGDGPTWSAFSGVIDIEEGVSVPGFRAAGLNVKDCIVLSVSPPEGYKSPFSELRETIPVRLTTDAWSEEVPQQQPPAYIPHFSPPPGLVAE